MKFTVSSEKLSKQLNKVQGAVAVNPVLDILSYYLFQIKDGSLTITATDMESTIITSLQVEAEGDFSFTIPAKRITDTIRSLPDLPVEFSYDEARASIVVKADKAEYNMMALSMEDFPELPAMTEDKSVKINSDILVDAFAKTIFATSNDEVRLAMQGVFVELDFNKLTFVATDAHKLVKFSYSDVHSDSTGSFILPKKSAALVKSVFDGDTEVTVYFTEKNAFFVSDGNQMVARLIDAAFPDYNVVIPADNPNHILVDRKSLINVLKRVIIFSNQTTNGVTFDIADNAMRLTAQDIDFSIKAEDTIPCDYSGEETRIGFSGRFLVEMLSNMNSDEVRIKISTPNRPSLIVPETTDDENVDLLMVLMPLVVQRM